MKTILEFSSAVQNAFDNTQNNVNDFNVMLFEAANNIYNLYTKEDANGGIRSLFEKISGLDWKTATPQKRRQDFRTHKNEYFAIIEDVISERLISGWGDNPFFEQFCETKNLAIGDKNEFYVEETSLMQVSKFAGNHHDILSQRVGAGKSFSVETSWYAIKCYDHFELFRTGKIDFSKMIDRMYASIDKYRKDAVYAAFMSADTNLPTDLVIDTPLTAATKDVVIELAEEIKSVTGYDIVFVGTKVALSKLNNMVSYDMWSEAMKNELHTTGEIGVFEGYNTITIPRVNEFNTRTEITDNTKILIVPVSSEFKPVKIVNEGDVQFYENGMEGTRKDMTFDAEIAYKEGVSVVISMLYGVINITV